MAESDVDLSIQKSARGKHHGCRTKLYARLRNGAHHPIALDHQVFYRLLKQPQIRLVFQHATNGGLVQKAVGLGARCANGRPFGTVQNTKLNTALVCRQSHSPAQCVDFFHQMALANAANRRIAAHLTQGFNVVGE